MKKIFFIFFISLCFLTSCQTFNVFKKQNEKNKEIPAVSGNISYSNIITVIGKGIPPEGDDSARGRLLAERAAIIDGYRLLSEKLSGIILQANSQNKNFTLTKDEIQARTETYIRGVKIVDITHKDNGIVEIKMTLKISPEITQNYRGSN